MGALRYGKPLVLDYLSMELNQYFRQTSMWVMAPHSTKSNAQHNKKQ